MFQKLLTKWIAGRNPVRHGRLEVSQIDALREFAAWLDSRRPSPRPADRSAIELLRRIRLGLNVEQIMPLELIQEIDAVLKTAGGG